MNMILDAGGYLGIAGKSLGLSLALSRASAFIAV